MSDILLDAAPSSTRITGALFETAVHWEIFYVLFRTSDCPFEKGIEIYLLDDRFKLNVRQVLLS